MVIVVLIALTVQFYQWMPAVIFLSYLLYGFLRPWLSLSWRRSIEEEIGEEHDNDEDPAEGETHEA